MKITTKVCAACGIARLYETVEDDLERCKTCGHLAPDLSASVPHLSTAGAMRAEILALGGHSPRALLCIAAANLFADVDYEAEARWSLRAADIDDDQGERAAADALRRRARTCLGLVRPRPIGEILRVLFDDAGAPPTVGALEQALGLTLAEAWVPANAAGTITLAGRLGPAIGDLSATYAVKRPIASLAALRARPLEGWSVAFPGARVLVELRLRERFGAPQENGPLRVYGAWTLTIAGDGCTLAHAA